MIKNFIFVIALFFVFTFIKAQSIELSNPDGPLTNGALVSINGDTAYIAAKVHVKNITLASISVKVKKVEISLLSGSENTFCWTACYPPTTYVSPSKIITADTEDSLSFEGEYYPHGNVGTTAILYVFYIASNPLDSVGVYVHYVSCLSHINELKNSISAFKLYPNPANSFVEINYSLPNELKDASFVLLDILGKEIKSIRISGTKGTINLQTSSLAEGIYFCTIAEGNNAILTRKLIVKH
ncbi:MAG: T9SS type A sorting domain-containing protein [Bacteroidales bacterium]|nr:T9SS type A sorting domain-containing protein [Bacteroidales bacterium]